MTGEGDGEMSHLLKFQPSASTPIMIEHQFYKGLPMARPMKLQDVLKEVDEKAGDKDITLGQVVEALEYRGYGPLLLTVALLTVLPTGSIPGVPTVTAILIIFISVQMLFGRDHPWIPAVLAKRSVSREKFDSAIERAGGVAKRVDRVIKPRLNCLFTPWSVRVVAFLCCLIALAMPPLELVPFLAFVPAFAITLWGLGLSARDGVLLIAGAVFAVGGIVAGYFMM